MELWTSSATHALLPLLASDAGLRLQLASGIASHERRFGPWPGGLWLPECAYAPGLERELADHGVRRFCVDQTDVHGLGAPEQLEPVATAAEVVAVPIDWQTVQLVWSATHGYPVHPVYRDYHRRTVHDLRPWSNGGDPYRPEQAAALARAHAREFVTRCIARLDRHRADRGRAGLLTFALDTELLGHWWYEGQTWLGAVFEEASSQGLELVTPRGGGRPGSRGGARAAGLELGRRQGLLHLGPRPRWRRSPSTPAVPSCARWPPRPRRPLTDAGAAALERAARELLALQSSDWAFQVTNDLAGRLPAAADGRPRRRSRRGPGRSGRLRCRAAGPRPAQPGARSRPGPAR